MGDPIRVVLADDDPAFLEALAVALELDGRFEVVGMAGDGGEAFQLGCWQEPDVVVMDAEMPRIDGWEAARLLSQSRPRTCVLMVSGADRRCSPIGRTRSASPPSSRRPASTRSWTRSQRWQFIANSPHALSNSTCAIAVSA